MIRVQKYDQCGELISGADVKEGTYSNKINITKYKISVMVKSILEEVTTFQRENNYFKVPQGAKTFSFKNYNLKCWGGGARASPFLIAL